MSEPNIEAKIRSVITDELEVEDSDLTPETSFVDDLGCDSLDHVELVMRIEEEFEVEISDEESAKIKTVQDAFNLVRRKVKHTGERNDS